jgi:hypothetical protein
MTQDITGIWRMVEERATGPDGQPAAPRFGPEGQGLVQFWQTAPGQGRMMAVLVDNRATTPPGAARDYNSYCGAWTFDGQTLTTQVDAALPALLGTAQVRQVRWEGARLVLSPPPLQRAGASISRELVWERVG